MLEEQKKNIVSSRDGGERESKRDIERDVYLIPWENVDESLKKKKGKKRRKKKGFKSNIAQDKHLNNVSIPIYRELLSSFFFAPVEKHFLNFSFSLSYFSRCISGKLLPLSFCRSKKFRLAIRVTF